MTTSGIDDAGLRRLYVAKTGADGNNGLTAGTAKLTIQAALDICAPGDIIVIGDGVYFETTALANFAGSASNPLWIVAENRGQATVCNWLKGAYEGTVSWSASTGGAFKLNRTQRPYMGVHGGDFLFYHKTLADLNATTLSVNGHTITRVQRGIAFDGDEVFVKLRSSADPNGELIKVTADFAKVVMDFDSCDFVIIDGLNVEGAGNAPAVSFTQDCVGCEVRNVVVDGSRFAVRTAHDMLLHYVEYTYTGFWEWDEEIRAANTIGCDFTFQLVKNYFNGTVIGGSSGNALMEGGLSSAGSGAPSENLVNEFALVHSVFDGDRLGEHINSILRYSVIQQCLDDGVQVEGQSASQTASGDQIHDCKFIDNFYHTSHQSSDLSGTVHVYRNVMDVEDTNARQGFAVKMLVTATAAEIYYYHNTIINPTSFSIDDIGTSRGGWYHFSNGTGEEIERWDNNVIVMPAHGVPNAASTPVLRQGNAYAATNTLSTAYAAGDGNVKAGTTEASMDLNADYSLGGSSPAIGIGVSIGALPDSRTGAGKNDDAGAFPLGETPGDDWPRPRVTTFDPDPPAVIQALIGEVIPPEPPPAGISLADSFLAAQRPVILIDFEFDTAAAYIWTLPYTGEFEGVTYRPLAGITGALAIRQSLDRPSLDTAAQVTGSADEIRSGALVEEFQLRDARVRLGNLGDDGLIEAVETLLSGTMQDIPIVEDGDSSSVAVQIESIFSEIDRPRDLRLSAADQKRFNPNDSFFDFVETVDAGPRFGG